MFQLNRINKKYLIKPVEPSTDPVKRVCVNNQEQLSNFIYNSHLAINEY